MKRYVFIVFLFIVLSINPAPYKPYPILFVHGMGSKSATWGAQVFEDENGNRTDSIKPEITDNSTFDNFLTLMKPYAWAWYEWEKEQGLNPTYSCRYFIIYSSMEEWLPQQSLFGGSEYG